MIDWQQLLQWAIGMVVLWLGYRERSAAARFDKIETALATAKEAANAAALSNIREYTTKPEMEKLEQRLGRIETMASQTRDIVLQLAAKQGVHLET